MSTQIQWECKCGLRGTDYERDRATPARAAKIFLFGCDACDPSGQDCYEFHEADGTVIEDAYLALLEEEAMHHFAEECASA